MSTFRGFTKDSLESFRNTLNQVKELSADYKNKINTQAEIDTAVTKSSIKRAQPITDAIKKAQDENTTLIVAQTDKDALNLPIWDMLQHFRDINSDLLPGNDTGFEINLNREPVTLANVPIVLETIDGRDSIEVLTQNPEKFSMPRKVLWLLMFSIDQLKKFDVYKSLKPSDIENYVKILEAVNPNARNEGKAKILLSAHNPAPGRAVNPPVNPPAQNNNLSLFYTDHLPEMSFVDFLEYILKNVGLFPELNQKIRMTPSLDGISFDRNKGLFFIGKRDLKSGQAYGIILLDQSVDNTLAIEWHSRDKGMRKEAVRIVNHNFENPQTKLALMFSDVAEDKIRDELDEMGEINFFFNNYFSAYFDLTEYNEIRRFIKHKDYRGFGVSFVPTQRPTQNQAGQGMLPQKQQRKRPSSYQIRDSKFGDVEVDVPRLYTQLHLRGMKGGSVIIDKQVDKDTLDLLTKREIPGRKYSKHSIKTLGEMINLANQPVKPYSRKLAMVTDQTIKKRQKKEMKGEGVESSEMSRLRTLLSSANAGNHPNKELQNEISYLSDTLLKQGRMDPTTHRDIYQKYVM